MHAVAWRRWSYFSDQAHKIKITNLTEIQSITVQPIKILLHWYFTVFWKVYMPDHQRSDQSKFGVSEDWENNAVCLI